MSSQTPARPSRRRRKPSDDRLSTVTDVHKSGSKSTSMGKTSSGSSAKKRETRFAKTWLIEGFKAFGRHIARNQIRVLLIDSFVMTTLFYPALALQLQRSSRSRSSPSQAGSSSSGSSNLNSTSSSNSNVRQSTHEDPLSLLSTPMLDNFFPYPEAPFEFPPPPRFFWESSGVESKEGGHADNATGNTSWIVDESDPVTSDRRPGKVDIGSSWKPSHMDTESTTKTTIIAAPIVWTDVQTVLATSRAFGGTPIDPDGIAGHRIDSGPLDVRLARVVDEIGKMTAVKSITCFDPVSGNNVEREKCLSTGNDAYASSGLSGIAYFKVEGDSRSGLVIRSIEGAWRDINRDIGRGAGLEVGAVLDPSSLGQVEDRARTVSLRPRPSTSNSASAPPTASHYQTPKEIPSPIIVLYVVLVTYLLVLLSRATNVHSRFGLAFTGVVELACSSIMSFSVMALLGFGDGKKGFNEGEAIVPYYILPFVILIVGVENMSAIVKAVYSVPVSYSVPDRVGLGLAKVGPSLLFTSLSDIAILAVIGFFVKLGPVRDFCLFASILIVVHFWMLITFFLTVLSIDCKRLELDDLLRQVSEIPIRKDLMGDSRESVKKGADGTDRNGRLRSGSLTSEFANSTWMAGAKKAWKARTARGGSLILLLSLLTGLYYANESRDGRQTLAMLGRRGGGALGQAIPSLLAPTNGPVSTSRIWHAIKPDHGGHAVIHVLPVTRILLPTPGHAITPQDLVDSLPMISRPFLPRLRPVFYFFKIILLPQCFTAFVVWLILLYLLKDADLLDAQRNKKYAGEVVDELDSEDDHQVIKPEVNRSVRFARQMDSRVVLSCESDIRQVVVAKNKNIGLAVSITGQVLLFRPLEDLKAKECLRTVLIPRGAALAAITDDGSYACIVDYSGRLKFLDITLPDKPRSMGDAIIPEGASLSPIAIRATRVGSSNTIEWSTDSGVEVLVTIALADGSAWWISSAAPSDANRVVKPAGRINTARFMSEDDSGLNRLVAGSSTSLTVWQAAGPDMRDPWIEIFKHDQTLSGLAITSIASFTVLDTDHLVVGNIMGFLSIWSLQTHSCLWSGPMFTKNSETAIDRLECIVPRAEICTQCSRSKSQSCIIIGSNANSVASLDYQVQHESQYACTCSAASRNPSGLRPADSLLSIPIKRTPRRASRTYQTSSPVNIPARRSPSPSPSQSRMFTNQVHNDSPPRSEVATLDSDVEEMDRASHESLDRLATDSLLRWTKMSYKEWAMHRGSFASLPDQGMLVITRKRPANANESLDAQWQTVVVDMFNVDHHDEALLPFALSATPLTKMTEFKRKDTTRMSLSAVRASRLESLNKIASGGRDSGTDYPLLAFSRARSVDLSRSDICLVVTGNVVHSRHVPDRPPAPQPPIIEEPPRKLSAFHTAPLAAPTLVTPRR